MTTIKVTMSARVAAVAALVLLLAVAAAAVDLCSQSFCACPDAGKRVECRCDVATKVSGGGSGGRKEGQKWPQSLKLPKIPTIFPNH